MMQRPLLLALATGLALASSLAGAADRNIQKWVDKNGVVHYGDAPPPDAVKDGRVILNEQGVVVGQVPRQMSPEEAAAAKKQKEEESRRRSQDTYLLVNFTNVADIERARDERLTQIDAQIELARSSQLNSESRLAALQKRMDGFRPYSTAPNARRVPDALAREVVQALGERRSVSKTVARLEQDRNDARATYDADIARYRELTNRPSIR
jgi:hypothetical protein